MVYAMHPEQNISIHVIWGKDKQNIVYSTGKSIINKSSKTNVGELMLKYNGGGHVLPVVVKLMLIKLKLY